MADNDQPMRRECGTMEVHERLLRTVPGYLEARSRSEDYALRAAVLPQMARSGCTTIPVVVHVVYKTNAQNISDAQIQSQIDVLNEDFRMQNADLSSAPTPFRAVAADARLSFELATEDPDGNPTDGIVRVKTDKDSFSSVNDDIKFASEDGSDAWPSDRYLNIWVGPRLLSGSGQAILGYAQFPGGPAATDGVVILHSAFGTTGTAAAPFNLGRTTTHEIGHWLNLRHIWGDDGTGCAGSDFVSDTPNQGGPNFGTPTFPHISCGNGPDGDMFVNYMDYVDDEAMVMFTSEQVVRMQAALDSSRSTIGVTRPCLKLPVKDLSKDIVKDGPKDGPKDPIKDGPKDGIKDFPKELSKDPPKEWPKDPPKEFPKDLPKDLPKDHVKDVLKDQPKEGIKDLPKDGPKDLHKEPIKEPHKESPKDLGKDFIKDGHKDIAKDGIKDFNKDFHKEGVFDPQKPPIADGPKSVMDPPKGLMEPPIDLGPGNIPFVLGTGGAAGTGSSAGTGVAPGAGGMPGAGVSGDLGGGAAFAAQRQQNAAVLAAYSQLLNNYAQLYAAGMLDASGIAAWQQAAGAYQRLIG